MSGRERVLVAMSGGVDSSVAAALLVGQGYDVVGATMKLFCYGEEVPDRPCCSLDSIDDARRVCQRLGVPHYVLNLEDRFGVDVVDDFVAEYARGRTPIPCVRCNTFTKFRDLLRKADAIDARWIATGHYARAEGGRLLRGRDRGKDQSYFLWGVDRAVVARMLLPVGDSTKAETRAAARALGLDVVAEKVESQDICFVPDGDHTKIIRQRLGDDAPALARGPIVLADGRVVGEHDGHARFTVGQRRGLPGGFAEPMYVVAIRPRERAVVIGPREQLLGRGLVARGVNWLVDPPAAGATLEVQVRHRARAVAAELVRADGDEVELALQEPVAAITPGQSAVLYAGEQVLGGGFIEAATGQRLALPVLAA
ncbi:tRNA 2-thiouridine(34) synthase MnmA [Roseisolibacter sp. H3M3-2]|uniref:tRNA 2-thiouridine(34) synthase MnmA n=1 Tax=Roseisolibacter sp. H3M3-2 TaxID=3031323 RepID=UPI0023DBE0B7|nr:tRNA 2-thiouridine(34) synthase MnmA [Roseisolibacter sp. H3M3-2]MDF1502675.1 tRNA 2-thiouridine(34) synthase MnmA [Roseisolibacter sp. H3M3-2]